MRQDGIKGDLGSVLGPCAGSVRATGQGTS
ncbi:hypothetical protein FHX81_0596 [Saccharothrix saharensis]|uniref:Uncharacterized protein n=2 Tax=Saccharothrix saharensis TaxID=571190 RepID=A0A543J663_9PSEU|nr:hypothetical protein FHX81_0596 [Saccharothrix saharensis]